MERGSELDPINVTAGAALGGDDVGSEVGPIEEPPCAKNGGEVEDRKVIGRQEGGRRGDVGGWSTSLSSHHYVEERWDQSVCAVDRGKTLNKGC